MGLTKENLLELLKSNILGLKNKSEELISNSKFKEAWQKEHNLIDKEISNLSAEDLKWLNDNYIIWSKENILKDINLLIKDNMPNE